MNKRALIIEDDGNIAELIRLYLEKEGFIVSIAENGVLGIADFERFTPDIILLDIMMPEMDGWEVCREIRTKSNVPIIMLTAKGETIDKIAGLEMGADDYITKPFEVTEMVARVNAVLRRFESSTDTEDKRLVFDNLIIDMASFDLVIGGVRVDAPPKEMELLYHLASEPNHVFTRNQLLDDVWGFDYFGDSRTVDVHVKRLREKLEGISNKWELKTVWGVGYKFELKD